MTRNLPTQRQVVLHAVEALDAARVALSGARDWLNSDTAEMDAGWPTGVGEIRIDTKKQIEEAKALIDRMKDGLYQALDALEPPSQQAEVIALDVVDPPDFDDAFERFRSGPSDTERAEKRADLVARARTVRRYGWDDYRYVWSSGEVAGVACVLGDEEMLREIGETADSVLQRFAYDLFGMAGGKQETDTGMLRTRQWFVSVRAALDDDGN